ncbi:hypothetical protein ABSL23_09195 [Halobacterium sp. NMX12-1]|jgi:hypothetical protein|uniref:Exonuclease RecJ n=1 Tax=Halobacterium sp. NMX12-1 TaxID=3166650 RepID=A0AAU8C9E7_9EURY
MATTGRTTAATEPDAESVLADAEFVRVAAAPTGGSIAAAAMLAGACGEHDVPYQVRVTRTAPSAPDAAETSLVAVGVESPAADASFVEDAPNAAFDAARAVGADPDPVVAFAGALADGVEPSSDVREAAGLTRRPGVGIPTADLAAGLAHSTRVHASFSGDEQAAGATLAELGLPPELDEAAQRRLASAVALDATGETARAADRVADVLRPHETPAGPFETVEGFADVLGALAWDAPGLGVALAQGAVDEPTALDAWRDHATDAHAAVRRADPSRYSAVEVVEADAAQPTVARLVRDYRARERAVLVVGDDTAALATTDADARDVLPNGVGTATLAVADAEPNLVETVRGEL